MEHGLEERVWDSECANSRGTATANAIQCWPLL